MSAPTTESGAERAPAGDVAKLVERITGYLTSGGLFNPELADHEAVRDLLIDCRAELKALSRDLADARAALEPFAAFAGYWDGLQTPDDRKFISVGDACKLTVGDLRRARSVLSTQPKETGA